MQKLLLIAFMAFCALTASAQSKATEKLLTDNYKGKVPLDNSRYVTQLTLQHCKFCDEGKFILKESKKEGVANDKPIEIKGDWTVIKGDAENDYATVVEIDAEKDILYFVRLEEGHLLRLDAKLRKIEPEKKYLLRKQ